MPRREVGEGQLLPGSCVHEKMIIVQENEERYFHCLYLLQSALERIRRYGRPVVNKVLHM
jgi:hypothetical protein